MFAQVGCGLLVYYTFTYFQFIVILANFFIRYLEERMKVPWPVSEREALLHYFELEYLKEDVVIVIMKTVRIFLFYSILDSFWELLRFSLQP